MDAEDIERVKGEYIKAAERAKRAGFDGVEVHCGYGYLLDSFLRDKWNNRTDNYGGSIENRARFPLEILDEVIKVWGSSKVGVKLSPMNSYNEMSDSDPKAMLKYFIEQLNKKKVEFLEVCEGFQGGSFETDINEIKEPLNAEFKSKFKGTWISNYGYNLESAN